jgi:hypothetical protein
MFIFLVGVKTMKVKKTMIIILLTVGFFGLIASVSPMFDKNKKSNDIDTFLVGLAVGISSISFASYLLWNNKPKQEQILTDSDQNHGKRSSNGDKQPQKKRKIETTLLEKGIGEIGKGIGEIGKEIEKLGGDISNSSNRRH